VIDLDHVALAATDARPALEVLVGELGGTVLFGGQGVGFRPMTIRMGDADDGMNLELLEPWLAEKNDFLARFVDKHGDGPHHLTFKVDDLDATLDRVTSAGYRPVNISRSDPMWQEAFLMPREAHGTVVQLAQSSRRESRAELLAYVAKHGPQAAPQWWGEPPPPAPERGYLRRVVLRTPSLTAALSFFAGLLGGQERAAGEGWTELEWKGGARLKLELRPHATPGVDRLELDAPAGADGVSREHIVCGTRLVVAPR
jgi:catechol 2,3-dioxygenase-like lactoylglutathione lyase family enzyme